MQGQRPRARGALCICSEKKASCSGYLPAPFQCSPPSRPQLHSINFMPRPRPSFTLSHDYSFRWQILPLYSRVGPISHAHKFRAVFTYSFFLARVVCLPHEIFYSLHSPPLAKEAASLLQSFIDSVISLSLHNAAGPDCPQKSLMIQTSLAYMWIIPVMTQIDQ